jgi:hypothetical protein
MEGKWTENENTLTGVLVAGPAVSDPGRALAESLAVTAGTTVICHLMGRATMMLCLSKFSQLLRSQGVRNVRYHQRSGRATTSAPRTRRTCSRPSSISAPNATRLVEQLRDEGKGGRQRRVAPSPLRFRSSSLFAFALTSVGGLLPVGTRPKEGKERARGEPRYEALKQQELRKGTRNREI